MMPDITDPEAVRFSNDFVRPIADLVARLYYRSRVVTDEWAAIDGPSLIPDSTDVIDDGSSADGRHPITGADANRIIDRLTEFVQNMEANGKTKLQMVLRVSVNPGAM